MRQKLPREAHKSRTESDDEKRSEMETDAGKSAEQAGNYYLQIFFFSVLRFVQNLREGSNSQFDMDAKACPTINETTSVCCCIF